MHLLDILSLRQVPGAGLYLSLTRRCPLSCAHCSTNSTLSSEEYGAENFLHCVESFTPESRPEVLVLTGGEPLLRARLVRRLTDRAHAAGTKVILASGMFFARQPRIPPLIDEAIRAVDHFTVSLDVFHEQQVPREAVFRVIQEVVDRGQDASFLVTGLDADDPYLVEVIGDIRQQFADHVPVLVATVGAQGRAKSWMPQEAPATPAPAVIDPLPCDLAAWPVVSYDGTVVACCNQAVVDGPAPVHLRLGNAAADDWATLRERYQTSPMLRAIRVFGPEYVADQYSGGTVMCDGYCSTCFRLSDEPQIATQLEPMMARPTMDVMEQVVATLQQERFVSRHGPPAYADLVQLGYAPVNGRRADT